MKRAVWLPSMCAISLALFTIPQGCAPDSSQAPTVAAIPSPDAPRPVTDLSQLGAGNALNPFGKHDQAIARKVASDAGVNENNVQNVGGFGMVRQVGDDKHPCEERLLNKKAARFDVLSTRLMDQVFDQLIHLLDTDEISHLKIPTEVKWVVITATLNSEGVLKELVIDQHSGTAAVDKMVIAACKKGLYIHNPPRDAADASGKYKLRLEARFENYASMDGEHWEFKTYVGLAIL
jgi:hypothetical protein